MGTVPGNALREEIENLLSEDINIKQIDEIQAHRHGPYIVINITICVDGKLSVREGDQIASLVEKSLMDNIAAVRRVHVHYHPYPHLGSANA